MKQFRLNTWGSFRCPGIVGSQNLKLSRRGSLLFSGYFWTSQFNIEHVRLMFLFPGICGPHTLKLNQRGLYVFVFLACFGPQPLKLNMRGSFCVNTCLYLKIENRAVVAHFLFCCWGEGGGVIFGRHYWTIDDFGFKKPQAPPTHAPPWFPPTHHPASPPATLLPAKRVQHAQWNQSSIFARNHFSRTSARTEPRFVSSRWGFECRSEALPLNTSGHHLCFCEFNTRFCTVWQSSKFMCSTKHCRPSTLLQNLCMIIALHFPFWIDRYSISLNSIDAGTQQHQ